MPPAHSLPRRCGARPSLDKPRSAAARSVARGARSPVMTCYIYQLPSWVLDDLCRNMDTLSEWDWMQFGECPGRPPAPRVIPTPAPSGTLARRGPALDPVPGGPGPGPGRGARPAGKLR